MVLVYYTKDHRLVEIDFIAQLLEETEWFSEWFIVERLNSKTIHHLELCGYSIDPELPSL